MSHPPPPPAERPLPGSRFFERINLVWALFFYTSLALGLGALVSAEPPLDGWWLAGAFALCAASSALFQLIFFQIFQPGSDTWPMPPRQAWLYFGGQALVFLLLSHLDDSFIGLGFALLGQTFGSLRPRDWPLPLAALFLLLAEPIGLFAALAAGQWISLGSFGLTVGVFVVIGLMISRLFAQRYQLLDLVGELRRAKAQVEAGAAQQEELAVLRERTRLAREMHDNIGHALVLVNVKLEAAQRLYQVDPARGGAELEATRELVRETMGALRHSLADLRAPLPSHHDLPGALRRLATELAARSTLEIALDLPTEAGPPPTQAEALWLIAREALSNVERHAAAASVLVALCHKGDTWALRVGDDGCGIKPADLDRPGHFGLTGMRERAEALGGSLSVGPRPGGGTLVEAYIPADQSLL